VSITLHSPFCRGQSDLTQIHRLGALYLVSYIDRGNIGNAYTAGMGKDWGITSDDYSWIVTILYIGYILFHWVRPPREPTSC